MSERPPRRDQRQIHIPAPDPRAPAGPPPRPGTPPAGGTSVFAPTEAPPRRAATPAARPAPRPVPAPRQPVRPEPSPRPRRRRRPGLRRTLTLTALVAPLLLLGALLGGYLYAKSVFDKIEKIPLADVLSTGGEGTNYLIVGSDSRDPQAIIDAGLDPAGFEEGGGNRSDTILLLRFVGGEATMMSIPRDLYVPIADTGGSSKINSAYNGGPSRLIRTIQSSLAVPIHHYMEVDFVSFALLVDSLGGITIDFPNAAIDTSSGLDIRQPGPNVLDGAQALSYVRSRQYQVVGGDGTVEPIEVASDLGRVLRQQRFLTTLFAELGDTRNPLVLARAASDASGGLRIDDTLGLLEAVRLGWRLRSLDPTSVDLPVENGRNAAGAVLFLDQPDAEAALAQFR